MRDAQIAATFQGTPASEFVNGLEGCHVGTQGPKPLGQHFLVKKLAAQGK